MLSASPRPSSVMIAAPSTVATAVRHERRGSPSTRTVQVPQPPCWQPAFGLVIPSSSRRMCSSGVSAGLASSCSTPLTVSLIGLLLREVGQCSFDQLGQDLSAVPARGERVVWRLDPGERVVGVELDSAWAEAGRGDPYLTVPLDGCNREDRVVMRMRPVRCRVAGLALRV